MDCIDFSPQTIPVEEYKNADGTQTLYGLNEKFKTRMAIAEFIQRTTIQFLTHYVNELPLDLDIERYWPPHRFGYKLWWGNRHSVIVAALRARWAFIVRWTYVAFLVCIASEKDKNGTQATVRPNWVDAAIKVGYMSENVWNDISQCWVFRADGKRVGGFVKILADPTKGSTEEHTTVQWYQYISTIVKRMHDLPLWFVYHTNKPPPNIHQVAHEYWPRNEDVIRARQDKAINNARIDIETYAPGRTPPSRHGKPWMVYVSQLSTWLLHRKALSTTATSMRTDINEGPTPNGQKARVYYWEVVRRDGHEQWYVSLLVELATIEELWHATPTEARVYNTYTGEWDICANTDNGTQPFTYTEDTEETGRDIPIDEHTSKPKRIIQNCEQTKEF